MARKGARKLIDARLETATTMDQGATRRIVLRKDPSEPLAEATAVELVIGLTPEGVAAVEGGRLRLQIWREPDEPEAPEEPGESDEPTEEGEG